MFVDVSRLGLVCALLWGCAPDDRSECTIDAYIAANPAGGSVDCGSLMLPVNRAALDSPELRCVDDNIRRHTPFEFRVEAIGGPHPASEPVCPPNGGRCPVAVNVFGAFIGRNVGTTFEVLELKNAYSYETRMWSSHGRKCLGDSVTVSFLTAWMPPEAAEAPGVLGLSCSATNDIVASGPVAWQTTCE